MIPKIFHQIWLGGEEKMPDCYKRLRDIMLTLHPDWDYMFWSEDNFPPCINEQYYNLCIAPAYKSDIMRYEILALYGGVYVDTDYLFYRNIEPLLRGIDHFFVEESDEWCSNSLMGCTPNHPYIWKLIRDLPMRFRKYPTKPGFERIGPGLLTETIKEIGARAVVFPRPLFYPIYCNTVDYQIKQSYPAAYAAHLWNSIDNVENLLTDEILSYWEEETRQTVARMGDFTDTSNEDVV